MLAFITVSLILVVTNSIVAVGLNIQLGYTGMVNLMSITCVAIGGYTTLVLAMPPAIPSTGLTYVLGLNWPFPLAVLGGTVVAGLFGLLVGSIALRRLRAHYFAIVTFCVAEITHQSIGNFNPLFGGFNGIYGLPQPGVEVVGYDNWNYFYLTVCLVVLVIVFLFAEYLRRRPFGRVLRAIREDQDAARAFGRNVYRLQLQAFVIGSLLAGLGGAMLVGFTGALDPGSWGSPETLVLITAIILGGSGNNFGVVLGMVLIAGVITQGLTFLPAGLISNTLLSPVEVMIYGALLIVVLRFRPEGLLPERPPRDVIQEPQRPLTAQPALAED